MKRLIVTAMATLCAAALFSVASAHAQNPEIFNYQIFPTQIVGQTCLENQQNKEIKCAVLDTKEQLKSVAQLDVKTHGSRDILIQFCAKVEDPHYTGLKCQATVDGAMAQPGSVDPLEQDPTVAAVSIYVFCLSWFGETTGLGKNDITEVDVGCEAKADAPTMNAADAVRIDSATTAVFSK